MTRTLRPFLVALSMLSGCATAPVERETVADEASGAPVREPAVVTEEPDDRRAVLTGTRIEILEMVMFEPGTTTVLEESFGLLDDVVAVLADNPQIEILQIEGHTDSTGGRAASRKLSEGRAWSVRDYLVEKGIDRGRLVARGFGPDQPIADNETEVGREANRRVDFTILAKGDPKVVAAKKPPAPARLAPIDSSPTLAVSARPPRTASPRVVLTDSAIQIADMVMFAPGRTRVLQISFSLLDEVAATLADNPQIEVIQIEGHTDSTGSRGVNRKLSQGRAESVRDYLVARGIERKRVVARGFGPDRPIADNTSREGREANRRVDFAILVQKRRQPAVEEDRIVAPGSAR